MTGISFQDEQLGMWDWLRREARLARAEIRAGRFQRSLAVLAAGAAIVSGFETYMQHLRGAFQNRWMWTPIWLTPPMVASAAAAVFSEKAARLVLPLVSVASIVDGVIGFFYHVRGIRRMPGGFKLGQYNIVMGPPIFAPLLVCIVGVLGTLASLLRRERIEDLEPRRGSATMARRTPRPAKARDVEPGLRADIAHGRFQQGMALLSAFFAVLAGGEAYFEHLRGSFNQRFMWTPVWVTPPMVAAGLAATRSKRVAHSVLPAMSAITFLDGMLGFALHLRGVKRMPGHFTNLQFNLTMGPPLLAPLLFCAVGLLGFIASFLRREEPGV
jgi:hypothetical protein